MLILWTSILFLYLQPVVNADQNPMEDVLIDPFDMANYRHGEKTMKKKSTEDQEIQDWIDPFDMARYSHKEKRMLNEVFFREEVVESDTKAPEELNHIKLTDNKNYKGNSMEKNFLQRLVNLLLNQCEYDEKGFNQETTIILKITPIQLEYLRKWKDGNLNEEAIRLLNNIFSYMTTYQKESIITDFLTSEEVWSNIAPISFALLPFCIYIFGGTMRRSVCFLLLAIFAVGFYKTHKLLLKREEVQNEHTLSKHVECNSQDLPWYQKLFGSNSEAECIKQLHALKIDPSLEVTPHRVISHMVAVGVLQPLDHFGIIFSQFSNQIFGEHSIFYGIIVFIAAIVIVIYVITVCCAALFGRDMSVGNKFFTVGMTNSTHSDAEKKFIHSEPSNGTKTSVVTPQNSIASVKCGHIPQTVIINNYPSNNSVIPTESIIKHSLPEKEGNNTCETKSVSLPEEAHKIVEITTSNHSVTQDASDINEDDGK